MSSQPLRRYGNLSASAGAVAAVVVVGYLDWATGRQLAFSIFYLLPVVLAAWYGMRGFGLLVALLGSTAWLLAEAYGGMAFAGPLIPMWNLLIRFGTLGIVAVLLRSLRQQLALARHRERTDSLTGLVARDRFLQLLEGEVARTRRYGHPLSLAYIDVDDFKQVNDSGGHALGDRVLRFTADALRDGTRGVDVSGRVGGDEFMLLMPETDAPQARVSIERLQSTLAHTSRAHGVPVTFSIGVLTFVAPPETIDGAVQQVDALMYEVKRQGKDGFLHRVVGA